MKFERAVGLSNKVIFGNELEMRALVIRMKVNAFKQTWNARLVEILHKNEIWTDLQNKS